jgi:hypothetical protein
MVVAVHNGAQAKDAAAMTQNQVISKSRVCPGALKARIGAFLHNRVLGQTEVYVIPGHSQYFRKRKRLNELQG